METYAQMRIYADISRNPSQNAIILKRDMGASSRITKFIGKTEIYEKDLIRLFFSSHKEIFWFYVSVNEIVLVEIFN